MHFLSLFPRSTMTSSMEEQGPVLNVALRGDEVIRTAKSRQGVELHEVTEAILDGKASPIVLDKISVQLRAQHSSFEAIGLSPEQVEQAKVLFKNQDTQRVRDAILSGQADPWTIKSRREGLLEAGLTPQQMEDGRKLYCRNLAEPLVKKVLSGEVALSVCGEEIIHYLDQAELTFDDVGLTSEALVKAGNLRDFTRERVNVLHDNVDAAYVRDLEKVLLQKNLTFSDIDLTEDQIQASIQRHRDAAEAQQSRQSVGVEER